MYLYPWTAVSDLQLKCKNVFFLFSSLIKMCNYQSSIWFYGRGTVTMIFPQEAKKKWHFTQV